MLQGWLELCQIDATILEWSGLSFQTKTEQCFGLNSVDISTFILNSQISMIGKRNHILDWGSHLKLIAGTVVGVGRSGVTHPIWFGPKRWQLTRPIVISRAELFLRTGLQNPGGTSTEG